MSYEKTLISKRLLEKYDEISSLHSEKLFQESLPIIEEILQSEDLKKVEVETEGRCRFLYQKAVALDCIGKGEESLEILLGLVRDYPGAPDFEMSLQVVCNGFQKRAQELVKTKPEDPILKSFLSVLEQCGWPPYFLIHAVAVQEAAEGKTEAAWGRMQALLDLSPNDEDYLRCALDVASHCQLPAKRNELLAHIQGLSERQPYRLDLVELLSVQGGALPPVSSGT